MKKREGINETRRPAGAAALALAAALSWACGNGNGLAGDGDAAEDPGPDDTAAEQDAGEDLPADREEEDTVPDAASDPDAAVDVEPDTPADADEDEDEDGGGGGCEEEIAAIAEETAIVGSCSGVVRLDYDSMAILGWQLVCGSYRAVTEADARAQAQADAGFGSGGSMLNAPDPEDEFVFLEPPGDFGGAAAVSARNGKTVFGGSIVWMGTGEIIWPETWRPAEDLGSGCPRHPGTVSARGYSLAAGEVPVETSDITAAVGVVWDTALPMGMATSGYVFDAVVILYARSVGAFDPTSAEWIVVLNGGWLE